MNGNILFVLFALSTGVSSALAGDKASFADSWLPDSQEGFEFTMTNARPPIYTCNASGLTRDGRSVSVGGSSSSDRGSAESSAIGNCQYRGGINCRITSCSIR